MFVFRRELVEFIYNQPVHPPLISEESSKGDDSIVDKKSLISDIITELDSQPDEISEVSTVKTSGEKNQTSKPISKDNEVLN